MPSTTFKKKALKAFPRQSRKLRRSSTQASPALSLSFPHCRGDTTPPRPISSNDVLSACTGTPVTQEHVEGLQDRTAHMFDIVPMQKSGWRHNIQSSPMPSLRSPPPADKLEVPKRASLMGLPVELRIMIFKSVFPPSEPRGTTETILYCAPALRVLGPSHSQLCRVNRQIYEETKELLYGQTLVFLSREALTKFSATRTPQQLCHLRSICLKPRVTDWVPAIRTLELPPGASLTVHWPIKRDLWETLIANITLDYRKVTLVSGCEEHLVIFEPYTEQDFKMPNYECLQTTFSIAR